MPSIVFAVRRRYIKGWWVGIDNWSILFLISAAPKRVVGRGSKISYSPSALATATMMAHSMRFLKRVHPFSYMPVTLPVAW